ncbi:MAG: hypothetical protein GY931_07730 [Maribacter sp.]|nr:hypothetical protein [Maribacter sp.]
MNNEIEDLEEYLGLKQGFFKNLQLDDDWSFIVKLNSLFEAAVSSLVTEELARKELKGTFSNMDMGTAKYGKLAFVKELDLLPENYIKYIETLNRLRNKFAHDISKTSHDLKTYLETASRSTRKECRRYLNRIESTESSGVKIKGDEYFLKEPRATIFLSGKLVLEYIRQKTIISQQVSFIKEKHSLENEPIRIKTYEHNLNKER